MKGTAPRGLAWEQDMKLGKALQQSEKNRAENIMIVDMVRNDLGRIAEPGSVRVTEICGLERYPTLFQMTSTVEGRGPSAVLWRLRRRCFRPLPLPARQGRKPRGLSGNWKTRRAGFTRE